jgi:hypothetical protein
MQVDALESNDGCAVCAQRSLSLKFPELPTDASAVKPPLPSMQRTLWKEMAEEKMELAEGKRLLEAKLVVLMQARESEIQAAAKVMQSERERRERGEREEREKQIDDVAMRYWGTEGT